MTTTATGAQAGTHQLPHQRQLQQQETEQAPPRNDREGHPCHFDPWNGVDPAIGGEYLD